MLKPHKLPKIFFSLAQTQTKHSLAKPYYVLYLKRIFNLYSRSSNFLVHCFTMIFGSLKASFHIYQKQFLFLVALCKSSGAALHQFHINTSNQIITVSSANFIFSCMPHKPRKLPKIFCYLIAQITFLYAPRHHLISAKNN